MTITTSLNFSFLNVIFHSLNTFLSLQGYLLLFLTIIIFTIGATVWLMDGRDCTKVGSDLTSKTDQEPDRDDRQDMDVQHAVLTNSTRIMNHDVNQVQYPTRRSYFIYNHRDPSGVTINGMLQSSFATNASVFINGTLWKGYELAQLSQGALPDSRNIVVNPVWAALAGARFRISTNNTPIVAVGSVWTIATTNPTVHSVQDNRNRDNRHNIDFLNNP